MSQQGPKPVILLHLNGTAEAVPFQSSKESSKLSVCGNCVLVRTP